MQVYGAMRTMLPISIPRTPFSQTYSLRLTLSPSVIRSGISRATKERTVRPLPQDLNTKGMKIKRRATPGEAGTRAKRPIIKSLMVYFQIKSQSEISSPKTMNFLINLVIGFVFDSDSFMYSYCKYYYEYNENWRKRQEVAGIAQCG